MRKIRFSFLFVYTVQYRRHMDESTIRLSSSTVFKYKYAEFSMYRGANSVLAPIIKHSAANPISAREHSKEIIMQQRSVKFS